MKSVLIVDDNTEIRENISEILELAGYKTFTAENGKQAVDLAIREKPTVIVCDIMMPELDGYGVLHMLRKNKETRDIPFIFITAKTERSDFRKGMEMGADDYITKPFEDVELLSAIEVRIKKTEIIEQKYESSVQGIRKFVNDIRNSGFMENFTDQFNVEAYHKKQILYQEGKRPRFLYYLLSGKIKGFKSHHDGKEYITDLYSTGDFIGHSALINDNNYEESAIVLEEAQVMQIPRDDFLEMIYNDIGIATKFIRIITRDVKEKEERLLNLAYSSLRKRIAKALADIHEKFGKEKPIEISRDDIAQYVGTATESLIRTLGDFKAERLIEIKDGKILINNIDKLKNLSY